MIKKMNAIYKFAVMLVILFVGCAKPPYTPKLSVNEAWDQAYNEIISHVIDCKECSKSFKGYTYSDNNMGDPIWSFDSTQQEEMYSGKFSECPEYIFIYKRATTFGDWQLYPMGWQWKGPTQEKYIWDYEKQKWLKK